MSNAMGVRSAGLFGAYDDEDKAAAAARKLSFTHKSEEASQNLADSYLEVEIHNRRACNILRIRISMLK